MNLVHFDVDEHLNNLLTGEKHPFSLKSSTLDQLANIATLEAVSVKAQSHIDQAVLDALPNLKLIVTRTVGLDHLDIEACKARSVSVYHIPDYGSFNIAEHAMGLILAGANHVVSSNTSVHNGTFTHKPFLRTALRGKTIGIVGTGRIGIELIKLVQAFGMKVIAFDRFHNRDMEQALGFSYVELETIWEEADIISLHVPLFPETHHFINAEAIAQMKQNVILVNTARGELIDSEAIVTHIDKFKAVCLDVIENEKQFSKDHPLLGQPKVIITPHIASFSDETIKSIARQTDECLQRYLSGDTTQQVA